MSIFLNILIPFRWTLNHPLWLSHPSSLPWVHNPDLFILPLRCVPVLSTTASPFFLCPLTSLKLRTFLFHCFSKISDIRKDVYHCPNYLYLENWKEKFDNSGEVIKYFLERRSKMLSKKAKNVQIFMFLLAFTSYMFICSVDTCVFICVCELMQRTKYNF